GERSLEIEPSLPAIGEHAPSEAALGYVIDAAEIAEHLRRRHAVFARAACFLPIKHPAPALGLDDANAVLKALPRVEWRGFVLVDGVREKEGVGHVVARLDRKVLLDRHLGPTDR